MTVAQNLAFALKLRKLSRAEIDRAFATRRRRSTSRITSSASQRRSPAANASAWHFGRAIVREPAAFLMDEPLSNLDAALRVQTRAEILTLQKRLATTTIYVTHDQLRR